MSDGKSVLGSTATLLSGLSAGELRRLAREDKVLTRIGPYGIEFCWNDIVELRGITAK